MKKNDVPIQNKYDYVYKISNKSQYRLTLIRIFSNLPLNSGAILKIVMHPVLANCPKDVSIKNNGTPHKNSMRRYGTKKAPKIKESGSFIQFYKTNISKYGIYRRQDFFKTLRGRQGHKL